MSPFPKPIREKNKTILDKVKEMNCCICGSMPPSDPHHILSRGSGGPDTLKNLAPLCRQHHTEWHQIGLNKMMSKYKQLEKFLILLNNR